MTRSDHFCTSVGPRHCQNLTIKTIELTRCCGAKPSQSHHKHGCISVEYQPTIGLSSGNLNILDRLVAATAAARVTVPTRPAQMVAVSTLLPAVGSSSESPTLSPQVANPEITSNSSSVKRFAGHVRQHNGRVATIVDPKSRPKRQRVKVRGILRPNA